MDPEIYQQAKKFNREVNALNNRRKTIVINADAKPYEMSFIQFVIVWYDKTMELILAADMPADPIALIMQEHQDQVLSALSRGVLVPLTVLKEYRFKPDCFHQIRRYCRANKIDLDA
jgi:hypothetical protein